jgi:hypothetical protein
VVRACSRDCYYGCGLSLVLADAALVLGEISHEATVDGALYVMRVGLAIWLAFVTRNGQQSCSATSQQDFI